MQSITIAAAVLILAAVHADKSPHTQKSGVAQMAAVQNTHRAISSPVLGGPAREKTAPVITGTAQKGKSPNGSTVRLGGPNTP